MKAHLVFCTALVVLSSACAAQPSQVSFDVRLADGRTTFRVGERVTLQLAFRSMVDEKYFTPAMIVDERGGEFDCYRFEPSGPMGWSDPLATYFKQDFLLQGHGWSGRPLLKSKPAEASLDLNQWVRFDKPGDYTIKVTSHCVSSKSGGLYPLSNTITVHIIPATPEWQTEMLASIRTRLERKQEQEAAVLDLRYLATPAAIDEMTASLRVDNYASRELRLGLFGLPESLRQVAIASMAKRIEEPNFPVSPRFFSTMSFLHVAPGSDKDSIQQQRAEYDPALWMTILSSLPGKEPETRTQTVQTLRRVGNNLHDSEIVEKMKALEH